MFPSFSKFSDTSRDFWERPISTGDFGDAVMPLMGPGQSPGRDQAAKLPEAPRI